MKIRVCLDVTPPPLPPLLLPLPSAVHRQPIYSCCVYVCVSVISLPSAPVYSPPRFPADPLFKAILGHLFSFQMSQEWGGRQKRHRARHNMWDFQSSVRIPLDDRAAYKSQKIFFFFFTMQRIKCQSSNLNSILSPPSLLTWTWACRDQRSQITHFLTSILVKWLMDPRNNICDSRLKILFYLIWKKITCILLIPVINYLYVTTTDAQIFSCEQYLMWMTTSGI